MASTIPELLSLGADDMPALHPPGGRSVSYSEMRQQVALLAGQLHRAGIQPGDRVALLLNNGPAAVFAFLAAASFATAAPLNPRLLAEEVRTAGADLRARVVVTGPDTPEPGIPGARQLVIEERPEGGYALTGGGTVLESAVAPRAEPGREALVLQTSGTTARPKTVPLTQANLAASAGNIVGALSLTPADRSLSVMPLFHIHGLMASLLAPLAAGSCVGCAPNFDAFRFFDWMEDIRATWYSAVPTMHQLILSRAPRHGDVIGSNPLRFIRSSSASLPPTVIEGLEATFGAPVIEAYGMTEASHQIASNPLPPAQRKPGSVGNGAGVQVATLVDGVVVHERGLTGEVIIRGPNVTAGYFENPAANEAAFVDGWFRTGDEGYLDSDGYLYLTGRLKELVNRGGEKIAPREVEEVLLLHPAVAEACVFAMPHETLGEEVAAAIVVRAGAKPEEKELRAFATERLASFKVPRTFTVVEQLPVGPTGKVQRIGMAARLGLIP